MGYRRSVLISAVDRPLARIALGLIWLYQRTWSRWHGRVCLFAPSCSKRSAAAFRTHGFFDGLRKTRAQLAECCGDYSMRLNENGGVELISNAGRVFSEAEINPRIAGKFDFARELAAMAHDPAS